MAEVGVVKFASVALRIGQAVLPASRSKFSKRQVTQPQLLAMLCLMRYEDWMFRETEARLAEHRELRRALGLHAVPDHTTLYRCLRRLDAAVLERALRSMVRRLVPTSQARRATVAVDGTGLAPGAISTFSVKWAKAREPGFSWRHWLKWPLARRPSH